MTNLKFIIIKVGQNYFSSPYYAGLDSIASKKVGYSANLFLYIRVFNSGIKKDLTLQNTPGGHRML